MIDEIISNANSNQNGYDKEAYKKMKREQLDNAYKIIDEALEEVKTNPDFLKEYFDVQARFDMYTPRNALLIAKQMPEAMQLKSKKDWIDLKATFRQPKQNKITILEPGESYKNKDGKVITPMNAKDMIDISETNAKLHGKIYDRKFLLQAVLQECPVAIKAVDSLESGKICEWNLEDKAIYVCRSEDYDAVINAVTIEISKINLYDNTNELDNEKAEYIGYMVCKKFGVDSPAPDFNNLVSKYANMEKQDIANDLTSMKEVALGMNNRIGQYLDDKRKDVKDKEQER